MTQGQDGDLYGTIPQSRVARAVVFKVTPTENIPGCASYIRLGDHRLAQSLDFECRAL